MPEFDPENVPPSEIHKYLARPFKSVEEMLSKLVDAARSRPDGCFLNDKTSTLAVGTVAAGIYAGFVKAMGDKPLDLTETKAGDLTLDIPKPIRTTAINTYIPLLGAFIKAALDVDMLANALNEISKTIIDINGGDPTKGSEDFRRLIMAAGAAMKKCIDNITHPSFIMDEDDECDCPACVLRRDLKKALDAKQESKAGDDPTLPKDIKGIVQKLAKEEGKSMSDFKVQKMPVNIDATKPETWKAELDKLDIPEEVKKEILKAMRAELLKAKGKGFGEVEPPTGFDIRLGGN